MAKVWKVACAMSAASIAASVNARAGSDFAMPRMVLRLDLDQACKACSRPHVHNGGRMRTKEARLLIDALAFAADKHRRQRRKDPEASPYINHPIALARVLSVEARVRDVRVLAAAVLHDTLEDTETTYEELHERFGQTIAAVVREVTDDKTLTPPERKRLQI